LYLIAVGFYGFWAHRKVSLWTQARAERSIHPLRFTSRLKVRSITAGITTVIEARKSLSTKRKN
jgi:hypothetical protein